MSSFRVTKSLFHTNRDPGSGTGRRPDHGGSGNEENKNRKPLAVLRLSSVDTGVDDVDMNVEPASKRDDQVSMSNHFNCFYYLFHN